MNLISRSLIFFCSRNLVLDENGTAVSVDKYARSPSLSPASLTGICRKDDEDSSDEEEEEEIEEESSEEEEVATAGPAEPELSRAERREQKKAGKASNKKGEDEDEDGIDPLLANNNRAVGNLKISDLGAPRELTRKEK